MAISTNSVIHFTERIEFLKGILDCGGFKLKYCLENVQMQLDSPFSVAFPLVSFCDIPLSEIKNHIDAYGAYGIGLSKNWAKHMGLNPVLYIEKDSRLASIFNLQAERIYKISKKTEGETDKQLKKEFFKYLGYCKNYEGRLVKGKINTDFYRFYDEREWRFVASHSDLNDQLSLIAGETYLKDKESFNEKIKDCFLKFSFKDISYIIIDNEDEIPEILKTLNDVYEDVATSKELKILSSKLLTKNQIWNDF